MTLETLSNIAEIIAAVLVIGSLIFVGIQLKQNTQQLKINQLSNTLVLEVGGAQMHQAFTLQIANNKDLADLLIKGGSDLGALDTSELARVSIMLGGLLSITQTGYIHFLQGHQTEEIWQSQAASLMTLMARPGAITWWQFTRNNYSESFRAWVDGLLGLGPMQAPGLPPGHPGELQTAVRA